MGFLSSVRKDPRRGCNVEETKTQGEKEVGFIGTK